MSERFTLAGSEAAMPAGAGARLDDAHARLASLSGEMRRLQRLGLELPLARCHQQIRYWTFVSALLALPRRPDGGPGVAIQGGFPWPAASR
jgi:hypothetical protein